MKTRLILLILFVVPFFSALAAQTTASQLSQEEVLKLVKQHKKDPSRVAVILRESGVTFDLDRTIEKKLRKAGVDDELLQEVWKAGPTSRAAQKAMLVSPAGVQLQASQEETEALYAIQNDLDPDRQLKIVDDFEKRFPNSQLLSYVYTQAAKAWQKKDDLDKVVVYGEKSLKLDADNLFSLIVLANTLPQPRLIQKSGAEREKRLIAAETYAERALVLIDRLVKRESETDAQFEERKNSLAADTHAARGMTQLQRDNLAKAVEEFQKAVSITARPTPQNYFRLGEAYEGVSKNSEAMAAYRKASELGQGTAIQKYADQRVQDLETKH